MKREEAYKQIEIGSEAYLVCCPMCLDALERGGYSGR